MEIKDLLRVQDLVLSDLEVENQHGPVRRHLLIATVSELFPQTHQTEARQIPLVFDGSQLARLRDALQALALEESAAGTPPASLQ